MKCLLIIKLNTRKQYHVANQRKKNKKKNCVNYDYVNELTYKGMLQNVNKKGKINVYSINYENFKYL